MSIRAAETSAEGRSIYYYDPKGIVAEGYQSLLNDDEATIIMVDSNIQREDITPGEKAGESGRTVHRYIRLTELIPEILQMVDSNMINVGIGERLSYLRKNEQEYLLRILSERNNHIKNEQAEQLKKLSGEEMLTEEMVRLILAKNNSTEKKDTLSYKTIGRILFLQ